MKMIVENFVFLYLPDTKKLRDTVINQDSVCP